MIDLSAHPVQVAYDLADRYGLELKLSFSEYFYRPQAALDERTTYFVPIVEITPDWVAEKIRSLKPGWELALNSKIIDPRNRISHIPMIDFFSADHPDTDSIAFNEIVGREIANELTLFNSGRSFHAYSTTLLGKGDWIAFMGRLLLLNMPNLPQVVDTRWVGHRLVGGYSALRWSANSSHHQRMPYLVRTRHHRRS
ncbi:hypothetical protein [Tahibacter soli]|uniref:Uncharacterized protein n=1 Tax=Tahibacter soli TaxID=2983605 RepID=A0A9X4BIC2_9GAMM|nr:hypothetical protein [Tahibacter soli]MDC8010964.1 hypothetical protein [Tahibacter soli]